MCYRFQIITLTCALNEQFSAGLFENLPLKPTPYSTVGYVRPARKACPTSERSLKPRMMTIPNAQGDDNQHKTSKTHGNAIATSNFQGVGMMNRIDQDQQPRRSIDEPNNDVRPSGVVSSTGSFRVREGERSSGGGLAQQHLPPSFLIDSALIHQLSGAPLQQYTSLPRVPPMHSNPLRYLNMGNSLPFGRLQQGQPPSAQHPALLHGAGSGVSHLLEELGVQHLVEQERQNLLSQSTLMRQDIPERGLSGDVGSAHSMLWPQAGSTDATKAKAEDLAGKSSKKKEVKSPPIPRPSRLPCRARGMPEDHDYNVSRILLSFVLQALHFSHSCPSHPPFSNYTPF
jgi:hypothetical protein